MHIARGEKLLQELEGNFSSIFVEGSLGHDGISPSLDILICCLFSLSYEGNATLLACSEILPVCPPFWLLSLLFLPRILSVNSAL